MYDFPTLSYTYSESYILLLTNYFLKDNTWNSLLPILYSSMQYFRTELVHGPQTFLNTSE